MKRMAAGIVAALIIAVGMGTVLYSRNGAQSADSECGVPLTDIDADANGLASIPERGDFDGDGTISIVDFAKLAPYFTQDVSPCASSPTSTTTSTPTHTPTAVPTNTATLTSTATLSFTTTPTPSPSFTPSMTATRTPTRTPTPTAAPGTRDKFKQPYASDSIWNIAIGSNATLAPANIRPVTGQGTFAEEIVIINRPTLAPVAFGLNTADWSGASRCVSSGTQFMAPAPPGFRIPDSGGDDSGDHGGTPNHPSGVMTANGQSYYESQPLTHCANNPYTTHYWQLTSVYGDGIAGSQGGSHMSGVGGTVRVGEWVAARSRGYINHALKLVLDSANYSNSAGPGCSTPGCRWPATGSDCGDSACGYSGSNSNVKMGSLLTMAPTYNCAGLRTEPGRLYCRTLQLYGAYIVDSGFSTYYLPIEFSPDGDAGVEFGQQFGFAMAQQSTSNTWALDVRDVMVNSMVVTNASATTPKGGGAPLLPNPPALGN